MSYPLTSASLASILPESAIAESEDRLLQGEAEISARLLASGLISDRRLCYLKSVFAALIVWLGFR